MVLVMALAGMSLGCGRDEVALYEVPKESPRPPSAAGAGHNHGDAGDPHQGMAMPARLKWDAPSGWEAQPAGGMRLANYLVPGSNATGQVSVVVLPQVVGRDVEVLNIFRERLQVPPLEPGELAALGQEVRIGASAGRLYDMAGAEGESGVDQNRLLVAVMEDGQASYYFNFFGPDSLIENERARFVAMLETVEKDEETISRVAPSAPGTMGGAAVAESGPASAGLPKWQVPDGWRETPPTRMLLARFEADGDSGSAEITVSMFPGDVGGTVANVNRWRAQIGLPGWSDAEVEGALTALEVEGGRAELVESVNEQSGRRVIGVIWPRGGNTWFYKMVGDGAVVARERDAFLRFVQSVRHGHA